MVAAQWGETRDTDARTGGGVSGRFRLLGGSTEVQDTTPPPFGTAPWGYRRSEVDAWASWVAGLVAHGRNETIRADSAEATLKATLDRLEQLERPRSPDARPPGAEPLPTRPVHDGTDGSGPVGIAITPTSVIPDAGAADGVASDAAARDAVTPGDGETDTATQSAADADTITSGAATPNAAAPGTGDIDADAAPPPSPDNARVEPAPASAGPGARTTGRLHFDSAADLPRRTRGASAASAPETATTPGTAMTPGVAPAPGTASTPDTATTPDTADAEAPASDTGAHDTGAAALPRTAAEAPSRDHDLARLHVVETTLHEVLGLLHQLADRDRRTTGS